MCGIAGVISWDDKYRVTRETLARMSAAIAHRGPDGEGFYLNHEREITAENPQCGFAFRRLAILDPDPRAMQPFTIGDKTIVFNGEIYNFRELRAELTRLRPEYAWRTTGDTEVLLLAYDEWEEKCLERLNGMFAFAVWDQREKSLFLARDRMGQKPLYFSVPRGAANAAVAFASELGVLRQVPWVEKSVSDYRTYVYLRWGMPETHATFCGNFKVTPGSAMRFPLHGRGLNGTGYFAPDPTESRPPVVTDELAVNRTRERLEAAVTRQLVSDVPIGCFLSGGVDSSVIALLMAKALAPGRRVATFSIGFDDPRYDESHFARAVADHLETSHHRLTVRPNAAADLPELARAFGEPFGDSSALPTHYLARETRGHVKVALSGDGGDELFGGYDRYRAVAVTQSIRGLPAPVAALAASPLWQRLPGVHPKSAGARVKRLLSSVGLPAPLRYATYLEIFGHGAATALLNEFAAPQNWAGPTGSAFEVYSQGRDAVQAALAADRRVYLPEDLLTKVDRASMLHGLEVRSPFMDHELVQFAAGLTTEQLFKGGPKRMLREAFADDLPAWVFKRKKMGFAVPIGEWFRGELRPMLRDNLFASDSFGRQHFNMAVVERLVEEHERQTVDHSQRLYALLMLELWWRTSR